MKSAARLLCVLPLVACLFLGGCLGFEEQTMSYHYDKDTDTLRIFQNYRGIFGSEAKGKEGVPLKGGEMSQLDSVLEGQRTFFFNNWIFEYDRKNVEGALADLKDPEKEEKKKPWHLPKEEKILTFLLENVRIENGPFYLEAGDKLSGVQSVTVTKFSACVAALNAYGLAQLEDAAEDDSTSEADRASLAEFGKRNDRRLALHDGNSLTVRWPMSKDSYDKEFGAKAENPEDLKRFRDAGIGIEYADGLVIFTLGKPDDKITRLTLPFSDEGYTCNVIAPVRERGLLKEDFDPKTAEETFLLAPDQVKKE